MPARDGASQLDDGALWDSLTGSHENSKANVSRRATSTGNEFSDHIDDERIADHALTQDQIQTDMVTPPAVAAARASDSNGNTALSAPVTVSLAASTSATPAFVQVNAATPQTNQSTVSVSYTSAQVAGDTNILAIGWNNTTSNITSVTDSAGNTYQLAVPTARGSGIRQAIYYGKNIKAAAVGTNTVTVSASTPFVDIRALEYSGLDPVNPFDVGTSTSGSGTSATAARSRRLRLARRSSAPASRPAASRRRGQTLSTASLPPLT
jgi:hypothetical protein